MNNEVPPSSNYNLSPEIIKQKVLPFYNLKMQKFQWLNLKIAINKEPSTK